MLHLQKPTQLVTELSDTKTLIKPNFMTLIEITAAMQAYADQRNTNGTNTMKGWYSNLNAFPYTRDNNNQPIPPDTEAYVHLYPGIVNNELIFFVISAYKDVSTNTNIANDVELCATTWINPGPPSSSSASAPDQSMPKKDALPLIQNWINNYKPWISKNIGTTNSIFQGFKLPQMDSSYGNTHNAILALHENSSAVGVIADVVVQDIDGQSVEYFDTAVPVPPFPPGVGEFYLYETLT